MKSQQANPTKFLEIRKGAVSEWKTSYCRGHVGAISKLGWQICEELGYETPSSQGKFFELPINDLLARNFSLKQVKSIENWLSSECWDLDTRREMVVNLAVAENFKNITLMKLLLLERSMFFAYELSRNQNKEFQSALFDTFANLLLRFSKEKPVQQLALRSLKHVEDDLNFHGRLTLPWKLKLEHRLKNSVKLGKIYSRARIFGVEGEWSAIQGKVIWITGASGVGKTTIGRELSNICQKLGRNPIFLDGDENTTALQPILNGQKTSHPKDAWKSPRPIPTFVIC